MNLAPDGPHFLDTSVAIIIIRRRATASPDALLPFAALAKLLHGVERGTDREKELLKVEAALSAVRIVYPNRDTLDHYAHIAAHLQKIGRMIPPKDIWNAALALQWDLPLLADDAHFARVPSLRLLPVR